MRYFFVLILAGFMNTGIHSQNLVLNPGLDNYITCPGFGQFDSSYILSWDKPTIASSDYYNFNCPGIVPTVQMPHSGEGYAGIIAYNFGTEYREYITGTFSSPLIAGTVYNVSFYASLNDGYIQAVDELGAYISNTAPGPFSNALHINVIPQVENTSGAVTDTAGWKQITGQFTAAGGEMYITIGNFHDDAATTVTQPGTTGSYGAYYFIDDVTVKMDNTSSIQNHASSAAEIFSPAPGQLQVELPDYYPGHLPVRLKIIDTSSRILLQRDLFSEEILITLPEGQMQLLIVEVTGDQFCFRRRILMNK